MKYVETKEIIKAGLSIDIKVTTDIVDGEFVVNFRDIQTKNFHSAALILQHIAMTEMPENRLNLVG